MVPREGPGQQCSLLAVGLCVLLEPKAGVETVVGIDGRVLVEYCPACRCS